MNLQWKYLQIHPEIQQALKAQKPIVALESAVITHGLPFPKNKELAQTMEKLVREQEAIPATIGLINGKIHIGLTAEETEFLASSQNVHKISRRDIAAAYLQKWDGGTTVAGTLIAAHMSNIPVFATGGIGGVHRGNGFDVSADIPELSRSPIVVVCAGAKSILDLPATLELLETYGVPVVGFKTKEFPAFYARESGLKTSFSVNSAGEIAEMYIWQKELNLTNAILVVNPVPEEHAIPASEMESFIEIGLKQAHEQNITGSATTPFLLDTISKISKGKTLAANLALLHNNAILAANIAFAISSRMKKEKSIEI